MPNPMLAVQKAIRLRLTGAVAVTALVPATSILDRNERPAPDPSIIIGEGQFIEPGLAIKRNVYRVFSTLHIWKQEPSLAGVKAIAGAVFDAIRTERFTLDSGLECCDCHVTDIRFLRDPDGETSHGVVNVEALVRELLDA